MTSLTILAQTLAAEVAALEAGTHPASWEPAVAELRRLVEGRWFVPQRADGTEASHVEAVERMIVFHQIYLREPAARIVVHIYGRRGDRVIASEQNFAEAVFKAARVIEALPLAADLQPLAAE